MVYMDKASALGIPLIKRFTGGGTVIVDENSILTSFIMHGPTAVPHVPCYPKQIMSWTEDVFKSFFQTYGNFSLIENGMVNISQL